MGEKPSRDATSIVFCGLQNGSFEVFDLGIQRSIYRSPPVSIGGGICSIAFSPSNRLIATGSSKGIVTIWDVCSVTNQDADRKVEVVTSWKRNDAGIESIAFFTPSEQDPETKLAVGAADGLPYIASLVPSEGVVVTIELSGGDCDPVRSIKVTDDENGGREVWTAGDDAVVRRYLL